MSGAYPLLASQRGYDAASVNRTNSDWRIWDNDPNIDWLIDSRNVAARAYDQFRNDPILAALLNAQLDGMFGSKGLIFRSLYSEDEDNETSDTESALRRKIEDVVLRYREGTNADASGQQTALGLSRAVETAAMLSGDGVMVRKWLPDRPRTEFATCWEFVRHDRIMNPPDQHDATDLYQGIKLADGNRPIGMYIAPPRRLGMAGDAADQKTGKSNFAYVPFIAADGTPNVIWRTGMRLPGAFRGISAFAPVLSTMRQVKHLQESYLIGKRIQASHPMFIECEDPVEAAKNDRNGAVFGTNTVIEPGKFYYVAMGCRPTFPAWTFNGTDMREYVDMLYRNVFAARGFPIDVVLCQLGETNMAASRSAWQQYYRTCEIHQDEHIRQVVSIMDECAIREAVARGELPAKVLTPRGLRARYSRPPRAMPDPLKEAQAVALWTTLKRDLTGLFAESGVDFRDSIMQRAEDEKLLEAQGLKEDPAEPGADDNADDGDKKKQDKEDA